MDEHAPRKEDHFSFGLWTVGNPGRDPFGEPVRPVQDPAYLVEKLAECGAWGVNLHDNDLVPLGASAGERDRIVSRFKAALRQAGMVVPMTTTNLFTHPAFKDGAFTANDPRVRAFALRKTMDAIDLGAELGAKIYVFWGGREGAEADACRDPREGIRRMRDALDFLCEYVRDRSYDLKFALEAKPNEPRGDLYFPTTGHMLHFITTLARPDMVGVNPEVAHETMSGLSMTHAVAQAMEAGKLFHIDLNAQKIGRYDQDLRFGSEDLKGAFLLVRLLEGTGGWPRYEGPRHFDAHAYRTEDEQGVWDFARGCMRTYKILKARARAFDEDREVKEILRAAGAGRSTVMRAVVGRSEQEVLSETSAGILGQALRPYTREKADELRRLELDIDAIARQGLRYERLDQIMMEHVLGARL